MTAALAAHVDRIHLPAEPGVSVRTCRSVLRVLARIAQADGEFRWGCRVSKIAALVEISVSTAKRALRYLIHHKLIERAEVGGGRASTRWRVLVEAIVRTPASDSAPRQRPATPPSTNPQLVGHGPGLNSRPSLAPRDALASVAPSSAPLVQEVCQHGGLSGFLPDGVSPRCPACRIELRKFLAPPAPHLSRSPADRHQPDLPTTAPGRGRVLA